MFSPEINIESVNEFNKGCMIEYLGIEFTEIGEDFIKAKMPVDHRTRQPLGLLHGGASVVLSESMGSVAAHLLLNPAEQFAVGLEINANHIKSAKSGFVYGRATPIHIGKGTQVWETRITNEKDELVCVSRLTMAILNHKK